MKRKLALKVKEKTGITLITLIITIIILLILAGITISAITGDNGIIKNAGQAKEETEIANEKEIVEKATVQAMGNNKYGNIEESELQSELDKETGEGKTEATDIGDEFEVIFNESNRYYMVDKDGNVGEAQDIIKDKNPGDITTGKDGETLDGSEEHPYEIWCVEDLVTFSNMVNGEGIRMENGNPVEITKANNFSGKYVVLKTSLNFKSKLSYQNSERTDFGDINGVENDGNTLMNEMMTGTGFSPIGKEERYIEFRGIFDGKENIIKNIYEKNTKNAGLFGYISYATVQNVILTGNIETTDGFGGGIIGIGDNKNKVINCVNLSTIVSNNSYAGGIIGNTHYSEIYLVNCCNLGTVKGKTAGGIIGRAYGYTGNDNILNCYNKGTIEGTLVGGIIGETQEGAQSPVNIYNSFNIGELNGNRKGGIAGTWTKEEIVNAFFLGKTADYGIYGNQTYTIGIEKIQSEYLKSEEFLKKLNTYVDSYNEKNKEENDFIKLKKWKLGEEGYPIFE